jgi:Ca2+-binding EF-hand superfamily protein
VKAVHTEAATANLAGNAGHAAACRDLRREFVRSAIIQTSGASTVKSFKLSVFVGTVLAASATLAGGGEWDAQFKRMDADADGKVTSTEHAAGAKSMFMKMDADKDGKVTAGEMDASHAAMKDKAHTAMKDQSKDSTSHAGKHVREMSSAQKIAVIDADSDGAITAAEHQSGSQRMFAKMDMSGDGSLSKEEFREGHKKMMTAADAE